MQDNNNQVQEDAVGSLFVSIAPQVANSPEFTQSIAEAASPSPSEGAPQASAEFRQTVPEASEVPRKAEPEPAADLRQSSPEVERDLPNQIPAEVVSVSAEDRKPTDILSEELPQSPQEQPARPWLIRIVREGHEEQIERPELEWLLEEHTLSPHQVARMTEDAGVRRSTRTIQDWCRPNAEGLTRLQSFFWIEQNRHYINEASAIAEIRKLVISNGRNYGAELPKVDAEVGPEADAEFRQSAPEASETVRKPASEAAEEIRQKSSATAEAAEPEFIPENEAGQLRRLFQSGNWMRQRDPEALHGLILKLGVSLTEAEAKAEQLARSNTTLLGVVEGNTELYKEMAGRLLPDREGRSSRGTVYEMDASDAERADEDR